VVETPSPTGAMIFCVGADTTDCETWLLLSEEVVSVMVGRMIVDVMIDFDVMA